VHILKSHPHLHVRIMNSGYGRLLFTLIFTPRSSYVLKVSELYSKLGFTTNFYNLNNNCKRARTRHICNLFRHLNLKWKVSYVLYGYPSLCNSFTWDCLNCTQSQKISITILVAGCEQLRPNCTHEWILWGALMFIGKHRAPHWGRFPHKDWTQPSLVD
jgi:hypothetical protein